MRFTGPAYAANITAVNSETPQVTRAFPIRLTAEDGTPLHGVLHSAQPVRPDLGFVVQHGFTGHTRRSGVRRILSRCARRAPTIGVDLRGHGRSGGQCTVGRDECHDLTAAVDYLRDLGCRRVVNIGFSLGAAVALRQAVLADPARRPDAVVAVSSPVRWWTRETTGMRGVHWLLEQPHGRLAARLRGVRLSAPWETVPLSPIEAARDLALPLLVVHGDLDHLFPIEEAAVLAEIGGGQLWQERGMGHAENATTPDLVDRITTWSADTVSPPAESACPDERTAR